MDSSAGTPLPEPRPSEWTRGTATPVDPARLDAWRSEAERRAAETFDALRRRPAPRDLADGLTIVLPTAGDVGESLARLRRQTLDPALIQAVVVGPKTGDRPDLSDMVEVRTIAASGDPLRIGVAAASRAYVTVVDDEAQIEDTYLASLLECAGPRILVTTAQSWCAPTEIARDALARSADPDNSVVLKASLRIEYGLSAVRSPALLSPASSPDAAPAYGDAVLRPLETIAAIQAMAIPGRDDDVLDETVPVQADIIGAYLQARPDAHPEVVRALDASQARDLPYERINTAYAPGLAIAYAFPPYVDTSAIVAAKRLRESGLVHDVLSNAMDTIRDTDPDLRRIAGPFVARHRALKTPSYFTSWTAMESFANAGLAAIREWLIGRPAYRTVYSRAHFAASHVLAAAYKVAEPSVTWRAEFSDPLSRAVDGTIRGERVGTGALATALRAAVVELGLATPSRDNAFEFCEEIAYALADELIFTNENQLEYMLGYCRDPGLAAIARSKAVVLPQPTLPAEFYRMTPSAYATDEDAVNIGYFGNFYVNRGIDDVLTGLASLDERLERPVVLHIFTTHQGKVGDRVRELGIAHRVRLNPYLPYLAFLGATTMFDSLVVVDADTGATHGRNPYLPSKWADYAGSGVPVWGLVVPGSPLERHDLAYASPLGDRDAAAVVIRQMLANKENRPIP